MHLRLTTPIIFHARSSPIYQAALMEVVGHNSTLARLALAEITEQLLVSVSDTLLAIRAITH